MNDRMPAVIDAIVTARSETDTGVPARSSELIAADLERTKRSLFVRIPSTSLTVTGVPSPAVCLESGGFWDITTPERGSPGLSNDLAKAWIACASLDRESWIIDVRLDRVTRATKPTSTTVSSVASLLRRHHRDERLRRMSPEARATYDRIRTLRDAIGPIDFDVVKALRELRDDG